MSPAAAGAADRARTGVTRLTGAWRALERDQRLAAASALALFVTMLLPWYSKTVLALKGHSQTVHLSAFQAFSFVEAAVLLVSAGVLLMLFARAERRAFHLPGGDGTIVMAGGIWTALLIFYRMLDKPSVAGNQVLLTTEGITWGIFVAMLAALFMVYAGTRIRAAHRPEPPLVQDRARPDGPAPFDEHEPDSQAQTVAAGPVGAASGYRSPARPVPSSSPPAEPASPPPRPRYPPAPPGRDRRVTREEAQQLSFEDPALEDPFGGEPPTPRGRRR